MSSTAYNAASLIIPNSAGYKAGVLQAWRPDVNLLEDINFSQNTANGSRRNQSGEIEFVAANIPRWNWPIGGGCPKLLLEPQRTNLLTYSEQFDNADWTKTNSLITVNAKNAPDGTTTADKLIADTSNDFHWVEQEIASAASNTYSLSIFAEAGEYDYLFIQGSSVNEAGVWFNLSTGAIETSGGSLLNSSKMVDYGNGIYKCSISFTPSEINEKIRFGVSNADNVRTFTGDGTSGIYIWGSQAEPGSTASSYIKTEATTKTRNKDLYTFLNLVSSGYLSATEGTVSLKIHTEPLVRDSSSRFLSIGTGSNEIIIFNGNSSLIRPKIVIENSTGSSDYVLLTDNSNIAITWDASGSIVSVNGTTVLTTTKAPDLTANSDLTLNGANRIIEIEPPAFYKRKLSEADVNNLTA